MQQGYKGVIPYYEPTNDTSIECVRWKDIQGYEGHYQISDDGRVRSVRRRIIVKNRGTRIVPERILSAELCKSTGYLYVNLHLNGKVKHCTVHRLVAQAFIDNPDNLPCVNHKNEDRTDNNVNNLEWTTNMDNLAYSDAWNKSVRNRRSYVGENNPFYGKHHTLETRLKISGFYSKGPTKYAK